MDFRSQRPEREVAPRSEPAHMLPPEEPQPKKETPPTVQHIGTTHHVPKEEKSKKRFVLPILIAIVVIILGISGFVALSKKTNGAAGIDSSKYQAVFFTNGQVYFGKLSAFNDGSLKLTNIFYLQTQNAQEETDSKNPQKTSTDQSNVQLIKLGNEVHGPEDEMIISKEQVLFYEKLKPDGKVSQTIDEVNKK